MGWQHEAKSVRNPVRDQESTARFFALRRDINYRGPIDQDGYAVGNSSSFAANLPSLLDDLRDGTAVEDSGPVEW